MSMQTEVNLNVLAQAINAANDGIVITDYKQPDNPIIFVNEAFEKITGYKKEEILHRNCRFLQGEHKSQQAVSVIRKAIEEGKACRGQIRNFKKNGTLFWNELSLAPIISKEGEITHFVGIQKDITKQKILEEALFSQAQFDPLTSLYNRRGFFREARRAALLAKRQSINLQVVMVDIDHFKKINDSHGHVVGDNTLMAFGQILKKCQRESDIIARYGGDEFILILFENENYVYENWLSRLNSNIASYNDSHQLPCPFSISAGQSQIPFAEFKSLLAAIKEADADMYIQKKWDC